MNRIRLVTILCLLLLSTFSKADSGTWNIVKQGLRNATDQPQSGNFYRVDQIKLKQQLSRATIQQRSATNTEIELPVSDGSIERFSIEESPIMAASLAARYPDIKTYKILGLDNPHASGRLSIGPNGFHGMITDSTGTFYIDPDSDEIYRAYGRKSQHKTKAFNCGVKGHTHDSPVGMTAARTASRTAGSLRVYRLAVAATSEYISAVGGSTSATPEIITAINRVNQIYQRDLGVKLELVGNNDDLLETSGNLLVAYSNTDATAMLTENQDNIDAVIGSSNYDIGHVFSTAGSSGGSGIAYVGSVCSSTSKAGGVTGLSNPVEDAFYIDFVAHEMGHQFNAEHTFNGTSSACSGQPPRMPAYAFEPGSGSTIMSYAGICGAENIVDHTDAMFHASSIDLIDSFTTLPGNGANCGAPDNILNLNEPQVDAGSNYNIPRKTPFILTATGSDADGDAITYSWDQMDAGTATSSVSLGADFGDNALFRSYLPQADNSRHFPALGTTLNNEYDDSESLACQTRSINFRVTVRDGNSGIGRDDLLLSVDNDSGPFQITSINELMPDSFEINWDVANTDQAPVNCAAVDISLLTFNTGKTTYAETILSPNETNDGSATVTLPGNSSTQARFKIQCSDNVFYDISDADLVVSGSTPFETTGQSVFYNTGGLLISDTPTESCTSGNSGFGDETNDTFFTADDIVFSDTYNYAIQFSNDIDYFKFTLPASGTVNIETAGTTDTLCGLYSEASSQTLISFDDDGGNRFNCLITEELDAGTYFISIEGAEISTTGDYSLEVSNSNEETDSGSSSSGGGSIDLYWLIGLFSAFYFRRRIRDY